MKIKDFENIYHLKKMHILTVQLKYLFFPSCLSGDLRKPCSRRRTACRKFTGSFFDRYAGTGLQLTAQRSLQPLGRHQRLPQTSTAVHLRYLSRLADQPQSRRPRGGALWELSVLMTSWRAGAIHHLTACLLGSPGLLTLSQNIGSKQGD